MSPDCGYYHYGEDVTLSCIVSYPTNTQYLIDVPTQAMVQWIKDGRVIDNDTMERNNDIYASMLTLSNIIASNAGIYNCIAVVSSNGGYIVNRTSSEANVTEVITVISG